jgi:tRNA threonylcarbamoyladenosine biosynthesis protein TsaE
MKIAFNDIAKEETFKVIAAILPLLEDNTVLIFDGAMGSGKTTLIKELCATLGVNDKVNSPTYSLVNEYQNRQNQPIYHFDFYRINSLEEAFDMGVEEYFYSGNLCLIEWADKIKEILPDHYLKISIDYYFEKRNYCIEQFKST